MKQRLAVIGGALAFAVVLIAVVEFIKRRLARMAASSNGASANGSIDTATQTADTELAGVNGDLA